MNRSRFAQLRADLVHLGTVTLDLFFPPNCVGCRRAGVWLCDDCAQAVEPTGDRICERCGRQQAERTACCSRCRDAPDGALRFARAAALYEGPLRGGIHHLRYGQVTALGPVLARYLVAAMQTPPWPLLLRYVDGVTPVPLHDLRRRQRGYNQAELLATALCEQTGLPLQPHWIHRQRMTHSQVGLNAQERKANVAEAFRAEPFVKGRTILLVDDVYTTGATLGACATAAMNAGATAVFALTLAVAQKLDADDGNDIDLDLAFGL